MKRLLISTIVAAAAALAPAGMLAQHPGDGDRIDFYNYKGERVYSWSVSIYDIPYASPFNVVSQADGLQLLTSGGSGLSSMKITPWGTEKYELTMDGDPEENVQTWYEIIGSEKPATRDGFGDVLCGSVMRIYVQCPDEKAIPRISFCQPYTGTDSQGEPYWYDIEGAGFSFLYSPMSIGAYSCLTKAQRQQRWDDLTSTRGIERVEGKPNLWYFDWIMPNEPLMVKASCFYADDTLLRACTNAAIATLYSQIIDLNYTPSANGEGYLMSVVGDYLSQDYISGLYLLDNYYNNYLNYSFMTEGNYWMNSVPWYTCGLYIRSANQMLKAIDLFKSATPEQRQVARAQMLTLRAHAYWRLMQIYGPRWADSNSGETLVAPLDIDFLADDRGPASMKEIADRCYADLDEAIEIFSRTNFSRTSIIEPDLIVAKAAKMRVAMLREDWVTAEQLSDQILVSAKLTTADEMTAGFFKPADSWLWGAWNNYDIGRYNVNLYYWSQQSWDACNGAYPSLWGYGSSAIDRNLYDKLDTADVRRRLYVMPDQLEGVGRFGDLSTWYTSTYIDPAEVTVISPNRLAEFYTEKMPLGVDVPAFRNIMDYNISPIRLGAQVKFYQPGDNNFADAAIPFLRTEEVLLTNAEAAAMSGNTSKALNAVNTLRAARGSAAYAPGVDVLDAVRTERKLELWGEGHSWFDQKRWNIPIHRNSYITGDTNSGNWPDKVINDIPCSIGNGWRFAVPKSAVKNNPLIDINAMGYKNMHGYEEAPTSAPAGVAPAARPAPRSIRELQQREAPLQQSAKHSAACHSLIAK